MKKNKTKTPKKISIFFAWIVLITCIFLILGLTYLKFFAIDNDKENMQEHPVNDVQTSPIITETLQTIVNNFNKSELVNNYKNENITINATLDETTITINYISDTIQKKYIFTFNSPMLNSTITNEDANEFKIIYKILVYACQQRLNNNNNIDSILEEFYNGKEVTGLSQKTENGNLIYSIDISTSITSDTITDNPENTDMDNNNQTNKGDE